VRVCAVTTTYNCHTWGWRDHLNSDNVDCGRDRLLVADTVVAYHDWLKSVGFVLHAWPLNLGASAAEMGRTDRRLVVD
jgi:hypothetical protein